MDMTRRKSVAFVSLLGSLSWCWFVFQFANFETVLSAIVDEFPSYLRPHKMLFAACVSFLLYLAGLPLTTNVSSELAYTFDQCSKW